MVSPSRDNVLSGELSEMSKWSRWGYLLCDSLCFTWTSYPLPRDCLHKVVNLLWKWQHRVSTAWWFRFSRANHSTPDLSAPLESSITCQELLTRLQDRKQSMGATQVRTPTPRGMAGLAGNQAGQAGLLGEASQKKSFIEAPGAGIWGRKGGYWLHEQIKHAVCWKSKIFVESPINVQSISKNTKRQAMDMCWLFSTTDFQFLALSRIEHYGSGSLFQHLARHKP